MCVFKYHAFIYFLRPPPWYGTLLLLPMETRKSNIQNKKKQEKGEKEIVIEQRVLESSKCTEIISWLELTLAVLQRKGVFVRVKCGLWKNFKDPVKLLQGELKIFFTILSVWCLDLSRRRRRAYQTCISNLRISLAHFHWISVPQLWFPMIPLPC